MNISDNKMLITGGAVGLGLGLTERFLKEQNAVIKSSKNGAALSGIRSNVFRLNRCGSSRRTHAEN